MKLSAKPCSLLYLLLSSVLFAHAQSSFKIKSYAVGYRISQINAIGNNPTTVSSLLKNPAPYTQLLNGFSYNSLYGEPGPQTIHTLYFNVELYKSNTSTRFWKKYTVQTGLFITTKMSKGAGILENLVHADSFMYSNKYVLAQNMQFAGINLGINGRFKIVNRLQASIGIEGQGGFAFVHNYQQHWDSSWRAYTTPWKVASITNLPIMRGKNFFQWQLMLPLGLEYQITKDKLFVRLEAVPGIVGGRVRKAYAADNEAHSAGLWFIYQP